ncbi:acylneuraminate cytidylyltransferase family protein [Yoonia litorea]|uniref:N-acylneuraminate cytidylyltransferase n=1 Tax=Yoonia litorea TaxID=1123755 RepID=A0A1I6MWL5_9RHOB|nr:acylneuraminate cytidylyltransferase family protein [Yoonia litorea]SFS20027.1 N-acylneuraminate cytidylyltransferase [Yoonia litorea]
MILGHIGVRKGSKGVPRKNFRSLLGRPLLDWSLDILLAHPRIDAVVVSTDDQEMYDHAIAKGTLPIGLRPDHLATDRAAKWPVWQHAHEASAELLGEAQTAFVDLDVTCPLREPADVDRALDLFFAEHPDMVMSCTEARKNPYFNLVEPDETGALHVSKPLPDGVVARQQAPIVYEHVGGVYVVSPSYLRTATSLYDGRVIPYIMPPERSLDIDSEFDWTVVEALLKHRQSS